MGAHEHGEEAPRSPDIIPTIASASFDLLARIASRGLHATVMIGGSSIDAILAEHDETDSNLPSHLSTLCARAEEAGTILTDDELHGLAIPLQLLDGTTVGALAAVDHAYRLWDDDDRALLADLAALFRREAELDAEIRRRRAAEESGELVARELTHRIKNTFTVIASLVALSARAYPGARAFAQTVGERIAALGRANDYVRPRSEEVAPATSLSLKGLIVALMAPYQELGHMRVRIEGEDAPIGPSSVTTLALILHELATNSVKYGALSRPSGEVTIVSTRSAVALDLTWTERGGPMIKQQPVQRGFGSLLSQRAIAAQLGGSVVHDWQPEGLVLTLHIPLRSLAK